MAVAADPISILHAQLEAASSDPTLDPTERAVRLRDLRERIADLLGSADQLAGAVQRVRESEASQQARLRLWARENADLREALVAAGDASPGDLDEAGFLSHAELDAMEEEGLLDEAIVGIAKAWDQAKHSRGGHGRFSDMYAASAPKLPRPPAGQGGPGGPRAPGRGPAPAVPGVGKIDERYQHYFQHDPEAQLIHVSRLRPTRQDTPEHVAKARANLDRAKAGLMAKRKPLTGSENGDGTVSIIDGNSTHAALTQEGLTHLPVRLDQVEPGTGGDAAVERVADEIASRAEQAEPALTAAMQRVTADHGGKLDRLEHRLKTRESLARKVRSKMDKYPGMAANTAGMRIVDSVRYTAVYDPKDYTSGVQATLDAAGAAGYKLTMQLNYWVPGDDYNGFHAILSGPKGETAELQFHTPDSLAAAEKNHPLYEQFRTSKDAHERWKLWQEMVKNAGAVETPADADALGGASQHRAPEEPGRAAGAGKPATPEQKDPNKASIHDRTIPATQPIRKPDLVTDDPKEALKALAAGKHVELTQENGPSTLLEELHKQVEELKAQGKTAPNIDLCKVTVKGRNIFCVTHQGIPRLKMPQLKGVPDPGSEAEKLPRDSNGEVDLSQAFLGHLISKGIHVEHGDTQASNLRASQMELNGPKVAGMAHHLETGGSLGDDRLFTSKDDYIVDGHHRWAATVGYSKGGEMTIPTSQVNMGILELLTEANDFTKQMGIKPKPADQAPGKPPEKPAKPS